MATDEFEGMPGVIAIRIDDRLIHGQVVAYWSNSLKLTRIMVANDEVAVDDMRKTVLRMAVPAGIKSSIIPVERAAKQILEGKYAGQRVFLIVNSPADILRLIDYGLPIKKFNVGNLGGKEDTKPIKKYVNVTDEQMKQFRELLDRGIEITTQLVPQDPVTHLTDYLDK
ncbi:PTS sugar transporter subunit IIB [uncultured Parolsenella sp.]|uniref:PTS system mannose/fructose/N-acetylgalactosamine-transporter subunit IIB n=1 Tax=uncultured Parolsenella sp. TaxID=2083008 RepID=UPI0027DB0040|nr:PTS sugar transporter subunit IIB [uncultured Parolsenella sp.]